MDDNLAIFIKVLWANKMTQWVRTLAAKSDDDLSSFPITYEVEEENQFLPVVL